MNQEVNPTELTTLKKFEILVAEDNFVNRALLKKIFDKLGYSAELVTNGNAALDAFDNKYFDLVFMDIEMPGLDGFETTRMLRKRFTENPSQPYIIALTANSMKGERERCLKNGMNDYLAKPFSIDDVENLVRKISEEPE